MSLWREVTRGVRVLTNRADADRDVLDEAQHYLDQATAAHVARGLSAADAQRAARLELGNMTTVRQDVRAYGWEHAVGAVAADLRYAVRQLRAKPAFTAATVLTLALGIGATTAIFSAVNAILFDALPYPHAERIVAIREHNADGSTSEGTFGMYRGLTDGTRSFDAIAVLAAWLPTITGPDQPERLEGQRVSASYFRTLGATPMLGRDFTAADDRLHGPNVVIIGDALWRRRFGRDRAIVGRPIVLDDVPHVVIGVMPGTFDNVLAPATDLWAPLQYDMSQGRAWGHHLRTIGRIAAGVSVAQAAADVNLRGSAVVRAQRPPTYDLKTAFTAVALRDDLTEGIRPTLVAIMGAVVLVLLIACVNVTNLLLARGAQRRGEFAVRAALGAGRGRLVRQLLTESLLLAAIGGVVGIAVAMFGVRALTTLIPPGLPRASGIHVDATVFAFGLALTTCIGLAFGVTPALQAARGDPQRHISQSSRRTAGGYGRTRAALVVAEVALALVLLVSSGLLLKSLQRLLTVPVGFDSSHLLTLQVQETGHRYDADSARYRFFAQALDAVQRVNGVTTAAITSQLPLSGDRDEYGAEFAATATRVAATYGVYRYSVSPRYLELMHIPLRSGRLLNEHDRAGAPPVALISESLSRLRFGHESPIGQHMRVGGPISAPDFTIVGVVGDVKQLSLALSQSEAVYTTTDQWRWVDNAMSLVVRTRVDAATLAPAIRAAIWSVDKDQPVVRVATMDDLLAASAAERRFALLIFEAFALAALALAAAGIYGVLAGSVAERTREIGVRSALGASSATILALVLRQGMALTGIGVAIGLAGAVAASRAIAAMLFGVSRLDPPTYLAVIALLLGVAAPACWVPAWRAARVDPAITLRAE